MADPRPANYAVPPGQVCAGGRYIHPNALLDLIAAAPDGGWIQANANFFSDCWAPKGLRTVQSPSNMFRAWSCFGWDRKRHGFWMWGGGHANYSGNEVYFWSAVDRHWHVAYLGSRYRTFPSTIYVGTNAYQDINGDGIPVSSHCYDNSIYLPIVDRFVTFGGAAQGDGAGLTLYGDTQVPIRYAGCYTLDPSLAMQGYVGGDSGTNMRGAGYETAILPGANAWQLRDWWLDNQSAINAAGTGKKLHINSGTAYREENGHDVVYFLMGSSSNRALFRAEFVDHDYRNDIIALVSSSAFDTGGSQGSLDIDPVRGVLLDIVKDSRTYRAQFVDLKRTWGTSNQWQKIDTFAGDPTIVSACLADCTNRQGIAFDPVRDMFVAWERGSNVWGIKPPEGDPTPTAGWTVIRLNTATSPAPDPAWPDSQSGTHGKWKYAKDMDVFIGSTHTKRGDVWAWKPTGWLDPRG